MIHGLHVLHAPDLQKCIESMIEVGIRGEKGLIGRIYSQEIHCCLRFLGGGSIRWKWPEGDSSAPDLWIGQLFFSGVMVGTNAKRQNYLPMSGRIEFITRKEATRRKRLPEFADCLFYDLSSKSFFGSFLSPFSVSGMRIPVPGHPGLTSKSVEAIWQGLKVIDGETDLILLESDRPKKRKCEPYAETCFAYAGRVIGMAEARMRIYRPAYKFLVDVIAPPVFLDHIIRIHRGGLDQFFHDVDDNADIHDVTRSYSHSALFVELMKEKIARSPDVLSRHLIDSLRSLHPSEESRDIEPLVEAIVGYFREDPLPPSVIQFGAWLRFKLDESLPGAGKKDRARIFLTLAEAYANQHGFTFATAKEEKSFQQVFTDENIGWKGVRKLLMRHLGILEENGSPLALVVS